MSEFDLLYSKLNSNQKIAVDTIEGPVIVNAAPGTGKTQILSLRVANILRTSDTSARNILCLTFTEAAASNMRERLASIIGSEAYKISINTFHGFATELINTNGQYFFGGAAFQPIDKIMQISILTQIFSELSWDNLLASRHSAFGFSFLGDAQELIQALKKEGITPQEHDIILDLNRKYIDSVNQVLAEYWPSKISKSFLNVIPELIKAISTLENPYNSLDRTNLFENYLHSHCNYGNEFLIMLNQAYANALENQSTTAITDWKTKYCRLGKTKQIELKDTSRIEKLTALNDIYKAYQLELYNRGWFDFDDMLLEVIKMLESQTIPEFKYNLQERYQFIHVDEFQDTNGVQLRFLDNLLDSKLSDNNPNIMVVGDPDQTIFKFQGAAMSNLSEFRAKYPRATTVNLIHNYRSKQTILDFAWNVIEGCDSRLGIKEKLIGQDR